MRHLVGLLAALAIAGAGVAPAAAQPEPRNESAARPPAVGDRALAIVPFVNLSGEPSDDWIGDGIVETTVAGLEQLDTVSILESAALFAAVTEELQAYGQDVPSDPERILRDVSRRLGAAWILTGSYERTDGALRFTARIVDVDTGTVATGVAVDGGASEIFDLQDRLVAEVAAALGRLQRNGFAPTAGEPRPGARPSDLGAGSGNGDRFGYRGGFGNGPVYGTGNARGGNGNGYGNGNGNGDGPLGLATMPAAVIVPPPVPAERPARPGSAPRDPVAEPVPTDVSGELSFGGAPTSAGFGVARDVGILTGRPTARPPRVRERPRIDGRLDDAVWRDALHITEFVQQNPVEGAPATEATDIWIAYDSQNFYVAVHAHYEDRSLMRANRVDRDQTIDDDNIAVYFDTFLDQQRAYRFSVNGYGVQGDAIVNSRGWSMGGRRRRTGSYSWSGSRIPTGDSSWDALFSSGGRIVDDGFTAEMAIPFKSLRYPQRDRDLPHRWGFQIVREVRGKDENQVWAPITRNVSGFLTQVGVLEGMTNLSMSRNIEVLPTFTAIQHGSLDGATFATKDVAPEGGLNVKYGITSNLTADLTYNPDFSQIESDLPQIEVNQRFALRYPELRPFFLEGAEIFQMFGPVTFVHTRTIVDPEFGAKLTGKVGDTTLGLIVANDEAPGRVAPGDAAYGQKANNLVARARYDLYAESHVGAFLTHRSFMDTHSTLGAVDGDFRLGNTQGFGFKAVQTDHRDLDGIDRQGQMFDLNYRLNSRHWSGWVSAYSLSPDFRHDVGFVRRTDMQQVFSRIGYTVWPESWVLNWGPSIGYSRNHSFDGLLQDEDWRAGFNATFARNISVNVELRDEMEHYLGIDFHKRAVSVGGQVNTSRRLSFGGYYRRGDEVKYQENPYLGKGGSGSFFASVRPASRFQSELNLSVSDFIDLRSGGAEPIFDVRILRALSTYQFTDRLLLRNISEYNTFDRKFALNWLFTYRVDAGTAFYVGYDDHYQQADRLYGDINGDGLDEQLFPTLLTMQRTNRAIFTKIQYLFRY
ncbi:MAG: DUF5916 domain-containing protein [Acidobacteria bacterium]|nr:DUF5916 domain-containing protein [Acidobacteriota bacterium]